MTHFNRPCVRYEFYLIDPETWAKTRRLDSVKTSTVVRDSSHETLGYATIDVTEDLDECYVEIVLSVDQNGLTEPYSLGVFLCQTPGIKFDGYVRAVSIDAYTPLIELKEKLPPLGYSLVKGRAILSVASNITRENVRAPIIDGTGASLAKLTDNFVANLNDTWLTFLKDLLANAQYEFGLDERSRILFAPTQELAGLQPVWTYDDGNSSILYPEVEVSRDLYGIPNVVEVVYSNDGQSLFSRVVNNDKNSPISTINRGREVVYRTSNPELTGEPTQQQLDGYARTLLRELSSLEYTLTYTHGYCPVRLGDCVMLNYESAGLNYVKAKVTRQSIKCKPGCPVEETAVYTMNLWG